MKYFLIIITLLFLLAGVGTIAQTGDKSTTMSTTSTKAPYIYPVAPGVWYPGDGALPEKPIRYYRVRCWPGCHRGSTLGKYPDIPLGMKPIFPTSTMDLCPDTPADAK